mgnify:CR=1 FL=1
MWQALSWQTMSDNVRNIVYVLDRPALDTQPQAYFLLLKGWVLLGGDGEFSVKWLSAMLGVFRTHVETRQEFMNLLRNGKV